MVGTWPCMYVVSQEPGIRQHVSHLIQSDGGSAFRSRTMKPMLSQILTPSQTLFKYVALLGFEVSLEDSARAGSPWLFGNCQFNQRCT
jgi:hypothetical protein